MGKKIRKEEKEEEEAGEGRERRKKNKNMGQSSGTSCMAFALHTTNLGWITV